MSCYAGKDGALGTSTDGGSTVTNIASLTSWSVSQNAEMLECTTMGDTWKEHKAGLLSWEGSAEANFIDSAAAGSDLASNGLTVGQNIYLLFYPENGEDMSFTGNAVVTSIENSASLGDLQTVSLSFSGTGSLTTDITV